jgi:hypothetical protein
MISVLASMAAAARPPAIPMSHAVPYVVGAYLVFLALILIYVLIMAGRLGRLERQLQELDRSAGDGEAGA